MPYVLLSALACVRVCVCYFYLAHDVMFMVAPHFGIARSPVLDRTYVWKCSAASLLTEKVLARITRISR